MMSSIPLYHSAFGFCILAIKNMSAQGISNAANKELPTREGMLPYINKQEKKTH